jgi:hypothetical protein
LEEVEEPVPEDLGVGSEMRLKLWLEGQDGLADHH